MLILPKVQGKLIKGISLACPSHIFASVTYSLTARWQNWNRNSTRLIPSAREEDAARSPKRMLPSDALAQRKEADHTVWELKEDLQDTET